MTTAFGTEDSSFIAAGGEQGRGPHRADGGPAAARGGGQPRQEEEDADGEGQAGRGQAGRCARVHLREQQ